MWLSRGPGGPSVMNRRTAFLESKYSTRYLCSDRLSLLTSGGKYSTSHWRFPLICTQPRCSRIGHSSTSQSAPDASMSAYLGGGPEGVAASWAGDGEAVDCAACLRGVQRRLCKLHGNARRHGGGVAQGGRTARRAAQRPDWRSVAP